jgi:hypothetical protein
VKKKAVAAVALSMALPVFGQTKRPSPSATNRDRLGMSCGQVLALSSTDWVAKYTGARSGGGETAPPGAEKNAPGPLTLPAIAEYGKCYDRRTSALAASLGREGKGPPIGSRGNFGDFEHALEEFEAVALEKSQPPAGEVKKAYAALYEKQFRYQFYLSYTPAAQKTTTTGRALTTTEKKGPSGARSTVGASPQGEYRRVFFAKDRRLKRGGFKEFACG